MLNSLWKSVTFFFTLENFFIYQVIFFAKIAESIQKCFLFWIVWYGERGVSCPRGSDAGTRSGTIRPYCCLSSQVPVYPVGLIGVGQFDHTYCSLSSQVPVCPVCLARYLSVVSVLSASQVVELMLVCLYIDFTVCLTLHWLYGLSGFII